jgi:putative oxidoreductase
MNDTLSAWAPRVLSILRIVAALMLAQHFTSKFFQFPMALNPPMFSLYWWAGVIEIVFGTLLLIGLFSRIAAFMLSGHMAAVYFIGHAPKGFYPLTNGGEVVVLFCFIFFYLIFAGPGPWSVDAMRGKA